MSKHTQSLIAFFIGSGVPLCHHIIVERLGDTPLRSSTGMAAALSIVVLSTMWLCALVTIDLNTYGR